MSKQTPKRIYLEVWPEGAGREDSVHYAQTGYGVDFATGACSRIVVYERVPSRRKKAKTK